MADEKSGPADGDRTARGVADAEMLLEALLGSEDDGVAFAEVRTDDEGRPVDATITLANPALGRLLGLPHEQLSGRSCAELGSRLGPDWLGLVAGAMRNGPQSHNGAVCFPVGGAGVGLILRGGGVGIAGGARPRLVLESLLDPHVLLEAVRDADGHIIDFRCIDANEAACRSTGRPHSDLVGATLAGYGPDLKARLLPALVAVVESRQPLLLDDLRAPSGSAEGRFDLRAVHVDGVVSLTWRDVTERFADLQRLHTSEERFRLTADAVPLGVAVVDLQGRFQYANRALCELLQRDGSWLLRHDLRHVLYPGELPRLRRMMDDLVAGSRAGQIRQRFAAASAAPVEAEHQMTLLRLTDGRPAGFLSLIGPRTAAADQAAAPGARLHTAGISVLVTGAAVPAMALTALLAQRPEFAVLPHARPQDLRARLGNESPDVVVALPVPGPGGPRQLAQTVADLTDVAPRVGLVVLSVNNRHESEVIVRDRAAPSAFLPINAIPGEDMLAEAIAAVSQGLQAFDAAAVEHLVRGWEAERDSLLHRLSDRELQVLELIAEGLDNQAIAQRLYVSVKATENYIGSVFRKLGLNAEPGTNRRVRAALYFLQERSL